MYNIDIYRKGYEAYRDGKPITNNPYLYASKSHMMKMATWESGWNKAKRDEERTEQ